MLIKLSTDKTVREVAAALQIAVPANLFGIMQVHNLQETMTKKGVKFARVCESLEFQHPENVGGAWRDYSCTDCHAGGAPEEMEH